MPCIRNASNYSLITSFRINQTSWSDSQSKHTLTLKVIQGQKLQSWLSSSSSNFLKTRYPRLFSCNTLWLWGKKVIFQWYRIQYWELNDIQCSAPMVKSLTMFSLFSNILGWCKTNKIFMRIGILQFCFQINLLHAHTCVNIDGVFYARSKFACNC